MGLHLAPLSGGLAEVLTFVKAGELTGQVQMKVETMVVLKMK